MKPLISVANFLTGGQLTAYQVNETIQQQIFLIAVISTTQNLTLYGFLV